METSQRSKWATGRVRVFRREALAESASEMVVPNASAKRATDHDSDSRPHFLRAFSERFAPQIVILSSPESLRGKRSSLEKEPVVRLVSSISLRFTPQSVPSAHSPHRVSNSFSLTLCTLKVTADDSFPSERLSVLLINVVGFGGH